MASIYLPAQSNLPRIDHEDPLPYYYSPVTGWMYRARLEIAAKLLGAGPYDRLLDLGYASGIFLPELARRSNTLYGVDIHGRHEAITQAMKRERVEATLSHGDIHDLPFADGFFDAIVCLSVLEHLINLDQAMREMQRTLSPKGVAILGFPVRNVITDTFFRIAGFKPRELHPSGHHDILAAAGRHFQVDQVTRWPRWLPMDLGGYVVCRGVRR